MEECGTCECGGQYWVIFRNRVECYECGSEILTPADLDFNSLLALINEGKHRNAKQ